MICVVLINLLQKYKKVIAIDADSNKNLIDYIFNDKIGKLEIENLESEIKMSVETNNPVVVIYTANYLQDIGLKKHSAICFETQEVPNLYRDKNINVYPTFIDENTNYEKYTKFIFENIN